MDKRLLAGAVVLAAAAAVTLGGQALVDNNDEPDGDRGARVSGEVVAKDRSFTPATTVIVRGRTVRFTNADDEDHTFTSDGGVFHSGVVKPGGTFEFTLGGVQTLAYHCEIHPGMKGTVKVT